MFGPEDWRRVEPLLEELLDLPPEDRASRLDELTAGDAALRERVRALLDQDERDDGILDRPFDALAAAVIEPAEAARALPCYERVGPYRVLKELGVGGMGEVLLAERADGDFEQQVALKIMRHGLDRTEIVTRFRRERRILARLVHPNIAALYDGGATEDGVPYFAMEYVEGDRITDWCDANRIDLPERLKLFESVCRAVQYAHRNLVIHRDIKPSNVFVTGDGAVKLLDFGIGKLLDADGTEETCATHAFLTPGYAAPEQLRGEATTTATDIFSLGMLLYVLLTGHHAHGNTSGVAALAKAALEKEIPAPSTRAGVPSSDQSAAEIAESRATQPDLLRRALQGDLDIILSKTLRKDPDDRYASVDDLRADLERHRENLPILARAATRRYRVRKFVRRNRGGVVAAAAILVAVLSGVVGVAWQAGVASRERDRAEAALGEERQRALELGQVADFQAEMLEEIDARAMGERLHQLVLDGTPPEMREAVEEGLERINFTTIAVTTLHEKLFQRTIESIDEQFGDQPLVKAQLLQTVAIALQNQGLIALAADPQQRSLELRRAELGDRHRDTLVSIHNTGFQRSAEGRQEDAERHYREAIDGRRLVLGERHPDTLASIGNLASLLIGQGRLDEAEPYCQEALAGARLVLGDDHSDTLAWIINMGGLLRRLGRLDEAEPYYREAVEKTRLVLGDGDAQTHSALNNMGFLLKSQGKLEEAELYYREALAGRRNALGDDHPSTMITISNLGGLLRDLGRLDEGDALGREAVQRFRANSSEGHWHVGVGLRQHAETLLAMGRFAEAEAEALEAHSILAAALGPEHGRTLRAAEQLAEIYREWHAAEPDAGREAEWEAWRTRVTSEAEGARTP